MYSMFKNKKTVGNKKCLTEYLFDYSRQKQEKSPHYQAIHKEQVRSAGEANLFQSRGLPQMITCLIRIVLLICLYNMLMRNNEINVTTTKVLIALAIKCRLTILRTFIYSISFWSKNI